MRIKGQVIPIFETIITLLSSYLASQAFISISIINNIFSEPAISLVYAIMIVILSMGFLFYGSFKTPFYLNIMLYLPEALCFSKINISLSTYTDAVSYPVKQLITVSLQNFSTTRSFNESLITGIIIISAHLALIFTSQFKNTSRELQTRGAEQEETTKVAHEQFKILLLLISASIIITISLAYSANLISSLLHQFVLSYDARYIVLGIAGASIMIMGLLSYLKNYFKGIQATDALT